MLASALPCPPLPPLNLHGKEGSNWPSQPLSEQRTRLSMNAADWRTNWRTRLKIPANWHVRVGLENRFGPLGPTRVQIPPPPLNGRSASRRRSADLRRSWKTADPLHEIRAPFDDGSSEECRSATSRRIAALRHSMLAIGDRRPGSVSAVGLRASRRVCVRVVERVDGALRCDGDLKACARFEIAHGKLDAVARGVPDEPNFIGSAQSLGELSGRRWW